MQFWEICPLRLVARLPDHQALLGQTHQSVQGEGEGRQDEDAGENSVDVEAAFRLEDQVAHALGGAQVLADDCADETVRITSRETIGEDADRSS